MLYRFTLFLIIVNLLFADADNKNRQLTKQVRSNNSMDAFGRDRSNVLDLLQQIGSSGEKETIGNVVFNVHHFTQFLFNDNQIYVYSPKKNDENVQEPRKWTFFYVPVLEPALKPLTAPWVSINKLEIRVRLALGTSAVEDAARKAIANQFSAEIVEKYSKSWVVAPLMLDSLSAYVVAVGSTPVPGILPFQIDNPNSNVITLRFVCLTPQVVLVVAAGLLTGDLDIEVSLYFSGMHRVRTNMMTITATQLQSVLSKTIADGGGTNATYIHRDQASSFVAKYLANVKKLIYLEDQNANLSLLTDGLEAQLSALFLQSIANAKEIQIKADAFRQVWQSIDLNPDRITSEMSKVFVYNKTETAKHNYTDNYYSISQRKDHNLPVHVSLDDRIRTIITLVHVNPNDNHNFNNHEEYETTTHHAVSATDIKKAASLASIEGSWTGTKFIPKSLKVFRLIDIVDKLQVAVIGKQLLAEKANGAVIRRVGVTASLLNSINWFSSLDNDTLFEALQNSTLLESLYNSSSVAFPVDNDNSSTVQNVTSFLTGEIKLYAGTSPPSSPWLLCDGSIVSRLEYPKLFSIIGTKYGEGYNSTTFKLPDLRGRVPLGVDPQQHRVSNISDIGQEGGQAMHSLTIDELPSHVHDSGALRNSYDGQHTHNIYDPGHNHGGRIGSSAVASSATGNYGPYNYQISGNRQWQLYTIPSSLTQISIYSNGNHTHQIIGSTGTVGQNKSFSILPPFQSFYYIIYAD